MPPLRPGQRLSPNVRRIRAGNFSEKFGPKRFTQDPTNIGLRARLEETGAPAAPAIGVAGQQPVQANPFQNFRNFEQFSANVRTRTGGGLLDAGADPFSGIQAEQHPTAGLGFVVDPFNRAGAPITTQRFAELQQQSAFLHKPAPALQGKQFAERFLSGRTGAEGQPEVPIMDIITGKSQGADIVAIRNPDQLPERVNTLWKAKRQSIRRDFSEIMRRNTGDFSLAELNDIGEQLASQNSNHRQFIGNMLQKFIKSDPNLKAEFDQLRLTGQTPGLGNAEFQQLEPDQQSRFQSAIEGAMDTARREFAREPGATGAVQGAAAISPELMTELGFVQDDRVGGAFAIQTFGGEVRAASAADVVRAAQERFGLGGEVAQPPAPVGGPTVGEEGIVGQAGIIGVSQGPRGTVVALQGGAQLGSDEAEEQITILRQRGLPQDIELAENLERAFGITVPRQTPAEGEVKPVPGGNAEAEPIGDQSGFIRRSPNGDTKIWDFKTKQWEVIMTAARGREILETAESDKDIFDVIAAAVRAGGEQINRTKAWFKRQQEAASAAWEG